MSNISIVIATMGRPSLQRAVDSVANQVKADDEILIIWDGQAPDVFGQFDPCIKILSETTPLPSQYGNRQRNLGMKVAKGDWICFLDDDDWHVPGSLAYMRKCFEEDPVKLPRMFRAKRPSGRIVWRRENIKLGNVGTCTVVVPNIKEKLPEWDVMPDPPDGISPRTTDFNFIQKVVENFGGVRFHKGIVYECERRR